MTRKVPQIFIFWSRSRDTTSNFKFGTVFSVFSFFRLFLTSLTGSSLPIGSFSQIFCAFLGFFKTEGYSKFHIWDWFFRVIFWLQSPLWKSCKLIPASQPHSYTPLYTQDNPRQLGCVTKLYSPRNCIFVPDQFVTWLGELTWRSAI